MAPVVKEFSKAETVTSAVCVTAQHREMLDQVLALFSIDADWDLDLMQPGQDLSDVTSRVLLGLRPVLQEYRPDLLLVHGDTTTAMAASLAGYYARIPIGHVEAGLRTRNIYSPWPEEINRQVVGRIARWHFAPTEKARKALVQESVSDQSIYVTGNTVVDALYMVLAELNAKPRLCEEQYSELQRLLGFSLDETRYVLITGHRRENFGPGFENICASLRTLSRRHPSVEFVYPVHLNPNVRDPVFSMLGDIKNVHLIDPLSYVPFVLLMKHSTIVLTDSGGIQEEAPSLGKPVLVMRDTTERPEALAAGTVKLVGTDQQSICEEVTRLLTDDGMYARMESAPNPYGDGKASRRILQAVLDSYEIVGE